MYQFQKLCQIVDKREGLKETGEYVDVGVKAKTHRVWHHSLTKKAESGSTAEAFANFHVNHLGWPGVAYHFIIEPKNLIKGPDGNMRARIVWAHDPGKKSYHVGNSNKFSLGICVAGDYRTEKLDEATLRSISELHKALVSDGIGATDKDHHEMPGYSWKACCVFDYQLAIQFKTGAPSKPDPLPDQYIIQEGDTFWSIAGRDGVQGVQVEDLITANPKVDPSKLKVGQVISLGKAKNTYTRPAGEPKKPQSSYSYPLPTEILKKGSPLKAAIKQLQLALNAIGYKCGTADGVWGNDTESAFILFQKKYTPYATDGIFGPDSRNKLKAALKAKGL